MPALLDGIVAAAKSTTDHSIDIKHVVADGDFVAVHSHVPRPGEPGIAVVHLFKFEGDRIAELWDIAQMIPGDVKNADGMF
jgi:predicted SnoaL-like aldol condensation-catalyzing enzyme